MKLIKKDRLYTITDLTADKIISMSDEQLSAYQETLANAVNLFPVQQTRLAESFKKMEYAPVLQWLKAMRNTLTAIHADALVKQCDKQLEQYADIENIRHDRFKTFIEFIMGTLTMLYKDIQVILDEVDAAEPEKVQENLAKKIRNQLATISELNETAIERLKDDQIKAYLQSLVAFVEECPNRTDALKGAFKMKNYPSVMRWLGVIEASLANIHADSLTEECRRQININNEYNNIRHEKLELFINYILTSLGQLCADIGSLKLE